MVPHRRFTNELGRDHDRKKGGLRIRVFKSPFSPKGNIRPNLLAVKHALSRSEKSWRAWLRSATLVLTPQRLRGVPFGISIDDCSTISLHLAQMNQVQEEHDQRRWSHPY